MGLSSFFKKLFVKEKPSRKVEELPVTIAPEFVEAKKEQAVVAEEKPKMVIKKKAPKKEAVQPAQPAVKKRAPKKQK